MGKKCRHFVSSKIFNMSKTASLWQAVAVVDYPIVYTPEYPRKQDNTERYGPSPSSSDKKPLKPITFEQLDRPATPLLEKDPSLQPHSPYSDAPPRPPLPTVITQGNLFMHYIDLDLFLYDTMRICE